MQNIQIYGRNVSCSTHLCKYTKQQNKRIKEELIESFWKKKSRAGNEKKNPSKTEYLNIMVRPFSYVTRKVWTGRFNCVQDLYVLNCWMSGKKSRLWSDVAFCGVWSESTLLDDAFLSKYVG